MVAVLSVGSQDSIEQIDAGIAVGATDGILVEADADLLDLPTSPTPSPRRCVPVRKAGTTYDLVLLGNDACDPATSRWGSVWPTCSTVLSRPASSRSRSATAAPRCAGRARTAPR